MTIFVAGVHGAGKTFLARPACERLGLVHATASQLIRQERGLATWSDDKTVSEVDENQRALISAVRRISEEGRQLVLDGHFVLRRAAWTHERLSLDVFRDLGCSAVLLIQSPVPVLIERLVARGDTSWDLEELGRFCEEEVAHGSQIAGQLGIPIDILESPSLGLFEGRLRQAAESGRGGSPIKRPLEPR
jgi:adenylate kinase